MAGNGSLMFLGGAPAGGSLLLNPCGKDRRLAHRPFGQNARLSASAVGFFVTPAFTASGVDWSWGMAPFRIPSCDEVVDGARHPIARAVWLHRLDPIIIDCTRFQAVHAHAEHRQGMPGVQPDVGCRCLAQVSWIRPIVHDAEMLERSVGSIACPTDNGKIGVGAFYGWPLEDPNAGFRSRRADLSQHGV